MTLNTNETAGSKMNQSGVDANLQGILPPKISKIPQIHAKEIAELRSELKGVDQDFRKKKSDYKLMKAAGKKESKLLKTKTQIKSLKHKKNQLFARLQKLM